MDTSCPLCAREKRSRGKLLYGQRVCSKCYYGFASRRWLAFVIDFFLFQIVAFAVGMFVAFVFVMLGASAEELESLTAPLNLVLMALFFCKDGLNGRSPGKLLCDVCAVDVATGTPIDLRASFKRNLPLAIPFVVFIVAVQLGKGNRWGDGWAKSKVIWVKYADHPIFSVGTQDAFDSSAAQLAELTSMPLANDDGNPYQAPRL